MPRSDVLKRIKDDILIENRIQSYRVHFTYLKTCLKYSQEFTVDKSKYKGWNLDLVKSSSFNTWWSKIGRDLLGKKLESIRQIKTPSFNPRPNTIVLEIPNDNPTEYSIEKIRTILNQSQSKPKREKRIHHLKLEIYLESWILRRQDKLKLLQIRRTLRDKRKKLLKERGNSRVAMKRFGTSKSAPMSVENFLKYKFDHDPEVNGNNLKTLQRQISRYNKNAETILNNVCNGQFPGDYTID